MEIRTEVHQAIMDARLLEIDVFAFLNKEADWGDDCPLTNFKTKHSLYGYQAHYFSIGTNLYSENEFDYKLYHEVLYTAVKVFVRERLPYYWYGNSTPVMVFSPDIKLKDIGGYKQICVSFITKVN